MYDAFFHRVQGEYLERDTIRERLKKAEMAGNPRQLLVPLEYEMVAGHRNMGCPSYEPCLSYAGIRNWGSFHCRACKFFTGARNENVERRSAVSDKPGAGVRRRRTRSNRK